jgi:hypothetical protein
LYATKNGTAVQFDFSIFFHSVHQYYTVIPAGVQSAFKKAPAIAGAFMCCVISFPAALPQ